MSISMSIYSFDVGGTIFRAPMDIWRYSSYLHVQVSIKPKYLCEDPKHFAKIFRFLLYLAGHHNFNVKVPVTCEYLLKQLKIPYSKSDLSFKPINLIGAHIVFTRAMFVNMNQPIQTGGVVFMKYIVQSDRSQSVFPIRVIGKIIYICFGTGQEIQYINFTECYNSNPAMGIILAHYWGSLLYVMDILSLTPSAPVLATIVPSLGPTPLERTQ